MSEEEIPWPEFKKATSEDGKARRAKNRERNTKMLESKGIQFESKNNGLHLVVCGKIDFWPSTGKWIVRSTGRSRRGVFNLISYLSDNEDE